ncbi:MAG: M28 family peptidase, partial [Polyangiaceae bacterium]
MSARPAWQLIEAEARDARQGSASSRFPLRAYSELMPPPYVGIKPYDPDRSHAPATAAAGDDDSFDITEYEQAQEIEPSLPLLADHVLLELGKLVRGEAHALSRTLLEGNPAWPAALAEAARRGALADDPLILVMPLALSRTQDDKGNVRWTLFGTSHDGPSAPFWRSFADEALFTRFLAWASDDRDATMPSVRVLADAADLPPFALSRNLGGASLDGVRTLVTFQPFARLPGPVQEAYLARALRLVPSPASLLFYEHPLYRRLSAALPRATQIPLLHLFPRCEESYKIRIPQSGWLDEHDPAQHPHGHRIVSHVTRTHRWQRIARDEGLPGDGAFTDKVTVALFSTNPDDLGLYGKPMARNAQIWTRDYQLLLDGPRATRDELEHAAQVTDEGGRFGYRFLYPPMRAGERELFWHLPLVARPDATTGKSSPFAPSLSHALRGYVSAEAVQGNAPPLTLTPRLLARDGHREAATLFANERGRRLLTTSFNARRLLEARELLGEPLAPSYARALLRVAKGTSLEEWLGHLADRSSDRGGAAHLVDALRATLGPETEPGSPLTFDRTRTRELEERLWRSIAGLAEGEFRQKENADGITVNRGKSGGPAAKAANTKVVERSDLELLGNHLHARYRELAARHGMQGRAEPMDHVFTWETDFDFPWSVGWSKNQTGEARERNVVFVIPGKNRREAVIMGDHYDTAYMEDVYEEGRGGDGLRAPACGADDNHSATTALLLAADVLLPLSRDGKLERDVWLVHLTGEEFPADCLGARNLAEALVEQRLALTKENGEAYDASGVRVVGAFILDMIAHNSDRDRDVFQIAPGEGAASARLAALAHRANERWNRAVPEWNRAPDRFHKGRAQRMPDGAAPPPPFAHPARARGGRP